VERNVLENCPVIVRHGSAHVLLASNVIRWDGGVAVDVWGWSDERQRTCVDVSVLNNTIINTAPAGRAVSIGPMTIDTVVANNLHVAPALVTGKNGSANACVLDDDLGSVRFAHNLWAQPAAEGWGAGWHYLGARRWDVEGFLSAERWSALARVEGEHYRRFSPGDLDAEHRPLFDARVAMAAPGVYVDLYGQPRPLLGPVTAGAVESLPPQSLSPAVP
jgi:hypothetical protein